MTQPISGTPAQPPGAAAASSTIGNQPLSTQQRTVLERMIVRLVALTSQQNAEVWSGVKHDLGLKNDEPLLSRHFPAVEQNLNQRLNGALQKLEIRQMLAQLNGLLAQGNNRQAVSDFVRQQYGQTALSQLTPEQLKSVLQLLQNNQMTIPHPQQRPGTSRPLLPAEHNTLNQLVTRLAAATGESGKMIWHSMLELSGVKTGELIPASHFNQLVNWLQARQSMSAHRAPTLELIQTVLKQPLDPKECGALTDYALQRWQATPQTVLTQAQVQDLLNQVFFRRVERSQDTLDIRNIQPIYNPHIPLIARVKTLSARPGLMLTALIAIAVLVWLLS